MSKQQTKRKPGRPTGSNFPCRLQLRADDRTADAIQAYAAGRGINVGAALREIVNAGMASLDILK